MNGKMEGEVWVTMFLGRACLKYGKVTNLSPIKISDITSVGDRTVISHLRNIASSDFRRGKGVLLPTVGAHDV